MQTIINYSFTFAVDKNGSIMQRDTQNRSRRLQTQSNDHNVEQREVRERER